MVVFKKCVSTSKPVDPEVLAKYWELIREFEREDHARYLQSLRGFEYLNPPSLHPDVYSNLSRHEAISALKCLENPKTNVGFELLSPELVQTITDILTQLS